MKWRGLLVLLTTVAGAALAGADEWVLGGKGAPWNSVVQSSAQIDVQTKPGAIQSRGFSPDENIVTTLKWVYGKPADLVAERGAA
ncbi:MAG: hypothetical protein EXS58_17285, partial [Candidatus Latescibacteria bacterium]|nr:hypothetical protein [Candidatus Latescibacterota bacterium]